MTMNFEVLIGTMLVIAFDIINSIDIDFFILSIGAIVSINKTYAIPTFHDDDVPSPSSSDDDVPSVPSLPIYWSAGRTGAPNCPPAKKFLSALGWSNMSYSCEDYGPKVEYTANVSRLPTICEDSDSLTLQDTSVSKEAIQFRRRNRRHAMRQARENIEDILHCSSVRKSNLRTISEDGLDAPALHHKARVLGGDDMKYSRRLRLQAFKKYRSILVPTTKLCPVNPPQKAAVVVDEPAPIATPAEFVESFVDDSEFVTVNDTTQEEEEVAVVEVVVTTPPAPTPTLRRSSRIAAMKEAKKEAARPVPVRRRSAKKEAARPVRRSARVASLRKVCYKV